MYYLPSTSASTPIVAKPGANRNVPRSGHHAGLQSSVLPDRTCTNNNGMLRSPCVSLAEAVGLAKVQSSDMPRLNASVLFDSAAVRDAQTVSYQNVQ